MSDGERITQASSGHGYKQKSRYPLTAAMTEGKPVTQHVEGGASEKPGIPRTSSDDALARGTPRRLLGTPWAAKSLTKSISFPTPTPSWPILWVTLRTKRSWTMLLPLPPRTTFLWKFSAKVVLWPNDRTVSRRCQFLLRRTRKGSDARSLTHTLKPEPCTTLSSLVQSLRLSKVWMNQSFQVLSSSTLSNLVLVLSILTPDMHTTTSESITLLYTLTIC